MKYIMVYIPLLFAPLMVLLVAWMLTLGQQFDLIEVVKSETYSNFIITWSVVITTVMFYPFLYKKIL